MGTPSPARSRPSSASSKSWRACPSTTTRSPARSRPRSASSRSWSTCEFPPRPRRPARRATAPRRRRYLYDNKIDGTFPVELCDVRKCSAKRGNNLVAPCGKKDCCDLDDGEACVTCAAPKYVLNNKCEACPSGFTCDGAKATKCAATNYVLNNVCTACPSGSTCDGTKATKCPAPNYVKDNVCTACAAPMYVKEKACTACPSGHTCDGTKATKCVVTKYVKANACTDCPSGHTCDGTSATACAANTFVADNVCKSADQCMDAKYLKDNKCPCESWCDYDFYDWLYDYYYYYNYYYYSDDPWYFENWEERCNWSACSGCDECQHKVCKDSLCHGSKDPWKVKCAWDISDRTGPSAPRQGRACSGCSACINLGIESSSSNSGGQVVSSSSLAIIIPVVVAAVLLVAAVLYLVRKRRVAARQPHRASSMPMPAGEEVQAEA